MQKVQLFLFHFAGGNIYSFNTITPRLKHLEVIPLELPGRGRRMQEPLLKNFDRAAQDLYNQVVPKRNGAPFLIYGHSMGAYLGLRVTRMLEAAGHPPAYLIVSGNPGPGVPRKREIKRYLLPKTEFIAELRLLGGVPEEVFQDQDLFGFFEPILRADFQVAEAEGLEHEPPVAAPLYALMGSEEESVDRIANWGRFTRSDFRSEVLEGNHFFIHKHPDRMADVLNACYNRVGRWGG